MKKLFFFLAVTGVLFSGCGFQVEVPIQQKKDESFKSEILKDLIEPKLEKKTVSLERSPIKIMESFISPYTNGDKSIGEHKILMVIDYGQWNSTEKTSFQDSNLIGGANE